MRLLHEQEWDLFCSHFHAVDSFYHLLLDKLDPAQTPDAEERASYEAAELALYRAIDAAIGSLLEVVDQPALTVLVSDHGAAPATRQVGLAQILIDAGLLSVEGDAELSLSVHEHAQTDPPCGIDWSRSQALPFGSCHVYLNLRGREPYGAVAPEEYSVVRERVIAAMLGYRDPQTGLCPFTLVLRKEDARVIGLHGDGVGDVVYALREEFSNGHGQMLGTAGWVQGVGSLRSLLLLSGAGVRPGTTIDRTVWLTDVVPTISYLTGLPVPRHAEGGVIYQALEQDA